MRNLLLITQVTLCLFCSCNNQDKTTGTGETEAEPVSSSTQNFKEGKDYQLYEWAQLVDRTGFTEPQEACSILLPRGWRHESDILWNKPGTSCAGTFRKLKASSGDGRFTFEMLPDVLYSWNSDPELMRLQQNNNVLSNCQIGEPMDAEAYLRNIFAVELGNPQIVRVESNASVVAQMREMNNKAMEELRQYGAGQMDFDQTAVNAELTWPDGTAGMVTFGVTILTTAVPNVYTGGYGQVYTTQVTRRTLFKYPLGETEAAKQQFAVIMSSFRTNPAWNDAVNNFWRQVRQQSHTVHVGKIRMMDERTRQIGEQTIRNGQQRLNDMDAQMRSWEQRQSSQDRMHTKFIKTIREVENFRDETGKYEMTAGYDHVWSRGDGNSFILSDNPNFDPSSVFQDQSWTPMKKVD